MQIDSLFMEILCLREIIAIKPNHLESIFIDRFDELDVVYLWDFGLPFCFFF